MTRSNTTKPDLRLRPVDGLLEDVVLAVPAEWMEVLRVQADKLGLPVADMLIQYLGHLVAEREALGKAVASPNISDAMARFRLSGSLLKSFEREADRLGVPVVTLVHRVVSDSASVFDGRAKEALPKPLKLAAPRRKWLGR